MNEDVQPLTIKQVFWAQSVWFKWQSKYREYTSKSPTTIDMEKSCLFTWMLTGHDPLPVPPPCMHAAPNHQMVIDGKELGRACCTLPHVYQGYIWFCGHPWKLNDDGTYTRCWRSSIDYKIHSIEGDIWTISPTTVDRKRVIGGVVNDIKINAVDYNRINEG